VIYKVSPVAQVIGTELLNKPEKLASITVPDAYADPE